MVQVDQEKYSAALQKFLGYNKEEADYVACDYNRKAAMGQVEPLRCPPSINYYNIVGDCSHLNMKFVFPIGTPTFEVTDRTEEVNSKWFK